MKKVSCRLLTNPSERRIKMKARKIFKRSFIMVMLVAVVFVLDTGWSNAVAAGPKECSVIGTWAGNAGDDMYWLGGHTAGSTLIKGELLLDLIFVSDDLLQNATRLTPGRGVWESTGKGEYKYTWYAYGINESGEPIYTVRVSGTSTIKDCDTNIIQYLYEIFQTNSAWPPQDLSGDPDYSMSGVAYESRIRLKVVTP
jgi:hypothetical protein